MLKTGQARPQMGSVDCSIRIKHTWLSTNKMAISSRFVYSLLAWILGRGGNERGINPECSRQRKADLCFYTPWCPSGTSTRTNDEVCISRSAFKTKRPILKTLIVIFVSCLK